MRTLRFGLLALLAAGALVAANVDDGLRFEDVERQTTEFMRYYHEIELTEDQALVFAEALEPLPAPCCTDRSALTCCCPCNQAKTWWGLSKYLIAEQGYGAAEVREKVAEWFDYTHPNGSTGDACYSGRCALPFKDNGCGGMSEDQVNF